MTARVLRADLHVHSIASRDAYSGDHATADRRQLAAAAAERGIELIAVTDHGPASPGAADVAEVAASARAPRVIDGVIVLSGIEANPVPDTANGLDVPDAVLASLDFVTVAFHPVTGWSSSASIDTLTEALLGAITNPLVDMIAHAGNEWFPVDLERVVDACVREQVIVEINSHSYRPGSVRETSVARERALAEHARDAGAMIAIDSDAHHAEDVGDLALGLAVADELGIADDAVVNRDAARVLEVLRRKRLRPALDGLGSRGEAR